MENPDYLDENNSQENEFNPRQTARRAGKMVVNAGLEALQRKLNERIYDIEELQVDLTHNGRLLGFGERVVVPQDEIHVVTAHGIHTWMLNKDTDVFGKAAEQTSVYRVNPLTEVIGLRTITFVVPVAGAGNSGVSVLDSEKVPFDVTAHVVAKLDEKQAVKASQRIGNDIMGLAANIREITEAQLLDAAATLKLSEVINNRQQLADLAKEKVNSTLAELGYKLVFITIADLSGEAYDMLVTQALSTVTKDTTIEINAAEILTHQSKQDRARTEAKAEAETTKQTENATIKKDEEIAVNENALAIANQVREKALDTTTHDVALSKVELNRKEAVAEAESSAEVQNITQTKSLVLADQKVEKQALIDMKDAQGTADRAKATTITAATATAEALKIETESQSEASIKIATANAEASEKQAKADIKKAEADQATAAAEGLALADIAEKNVEIAGKQVTVDKNKGLADVEIAKGNAAVEIDLATKMQELDLQRKTQIAALLKGNPELLELEKTQVENAHNLEITKIKSAAQIEMLKAIAPQMDLNLNLFGDGGQLGSIMAQVMAIAKGATIVGEEIPAVANLFSSKKSTDPLGGSIGELTGRFLPFVKKVIDEADPKVFSSMTVSGLIDALAPVIAGNTDLSTALETLKNNHSTRMIMDVPIESFLKNFGIGQGPKDDAVVA